MAAGLSFWLGAALPFSPVTAALLASLLAGLLIGSWWALPAVAPTGLIVSLVSDRGGELLSGGFLWLVVAQGFMVGLPMALGVAAARNRARRREDGADATNVLLARAWAHLFDLALVVVPAEALVGEADSGWVGTVAFVGGSAWLQSRYGWTPGKWLAGLRVQKLDGSVPSFREAFVRSITFLFEWIGVIGLGVARASRLKQRVGDRWAGTIVRAAEAEYY